MHNAYVEFYHFYHFIIRNLSFLSKPWHNLMKRHNLWYDNDLRMNIPKKTMVSTSSTMISTSTPPVSNRSQRKVGIRLWLQLCKIDGTEAIKFLIHSYIHSFRAYLLLWYVVRYSLRITQYRKRSFDFPQLTLSSTSLNTGLVRISVQFIKYNRNKTRFLTRPKQLSYRICSNNKPIYWIMLLHVLQTS